MLHLLHNLGALQGLLSSTPQCTVCGVRPDLPVVIGKLLGRLVTDAAITVSETVYENCRVTTLNLPVVPSAVANCTTGPCTAVSVTVPWKPDVG